MKEVTCHSAASLHESSVSDQTTVQLLMQEEFRTRSGPATSTENREIHQWTLVWKTNTSVTTVNSVPTMESSMWGN